MITKHRAAPAAILGAILTVAAIVLFALAAQAHNNIAEDAALDSIVQSGLGGPACQDLNTGAYICQDADTDRAGRDRAHERNFILAGSVAGGFAVLSFATSGLLARGPRRPRRVVVVGATASERLRELEGLRSDGLIADDEYDARRAKIIEDV